MFFNHCKITTSQESIIQLELDDDDEEESDISPHHHQRRRFSVSPMPQIRSAMESQVKQLNTHTYSFMIHKYL